MSRGAKRHATRDTRHCNKTGALTRLPRGLPALWIGAAPQGDADGEDQNLNPIRVVLMAKRSAEKIREALRGSGRPSRSRKGFESGKLYSGTRRWPPEGLSVALRGGRWPIDTCYPQSNDAALWLCSVASQTPEPNS